MFTEEVEREFSREETTIGRDRGHTGRDGERVIYKREGRQREGVEMLEMSLG